MILQAIQNSNNFYINNFVSIFKVCAAPLVLISAFNAYNSTSLNMGVQVLTLLMQLHLSAVLILVTNDIKESNLKDASDYMIKPFFFLGPLLLVGLAVGLATLLGFILFIIPGIYLLGKLFYGQYYLLLRGKNAAASIEQAWLLSHEKSWRNGILISFLVISITFVTSFVTIPFSNFLTSQASLALFIVQIIGFLFTVYMNIFMYTLFLQDEHEARAIN